MTLALIFDELLLKASQQSLAAIGPTAAFATRLWHRSHWSRPDLSLTPSKRGDCAEAKKLRNTISTHLSGAQMM